MPNRIRALRLERAKLVPTAFTVAALSQRLGVTEGMVRRWERDANRPSQRHARALAKELGVTVDQLQLDESAPEDDEADAN